MSSVIGKSKCQREGVKVTWVEAKTAMKWFLVLAVLMARSTGRVGPVVLGRDMLERDRGGLLAEKGGVVSRCLVIEN
jgi:hypothetical protein